MATLKEIKRRIGSVKNTQKITRAMKLVSTAKFAKANQAIRNANHYGQALDELMAKVSQSVESMQGAGSKKSSASEASQRSLSLLGVREEKTVAICLFTSDRGQCGALNSNVIRQASRLIVKKVTEEKKSVKLFLMGKKGLSFYRRPGKDLCREILKIDAGSLEVNIAEHFLKVCDAPDFIFARERALSFKDMYLEGEIDGVYCIYPKFESALSQVPTVEKILPVSMDDNAGENAEAQKSGGAASNSVAQSGNYLIEPDPVAVVAELIDKQLANKLFRMILNTAASEHGARMTAMDSATNNASDVIDKLTLVYNRGRQAAITKELIEITSGASAL